MNHAHRGFPSVRMFLLLYHVLAHLLGSDTRTVVVLLDVGEAQPPGRILVNSFLANRHIQLSIVIRIGIKCILIDAEDILYLTIYRLQS